MVSVKPGLRVVKPGPPAGPVVLGAVGVAAASSRRDLLGALRDRIAADIDAGVLARDLASLSKRLLDISAELEGLVVAEDGDDISAAASAPDEAWSG